MARGRQTKTYDIRRWLSTAMDVALANSFLSSCTDISDRTCAPPPPFSKRPSHTHTRTCTRANTHPRARQARAPAPGGAPAPHSTLRRVSCRGKGAPSAPSSCPPPGNPPSRRSSSGRRLSEGEASAGLRAYLQAELLLVQCADEHVEKRRRILRPRPSHARLCGRLHRCN
jgi:hypothetical protein